MDRIKIKVKVDRTRKSGYLRSLKLTKVYAKLIKICTASSRHLMLDVLQKACYKACWHYSRNVCAQGYSSSCSCANVSNLPLYDFRGL